MKFGKTIASAFLLLFLCTEVLAQPHAADYSKNWKAVEAYEKKGLSRSALQEVIKIFDLAISSGNQVQQVKAAMYQMKYRNLIEEDNRENNIFFIDTLIAKTRIPAKNILQSMQAELFLSYKQRNRYKFYDRTRLIEEKNTDITTWSLDKLNRTIASLYKASLKNETTLKNTSLNLFDPIIEKGQNTRQLRPTLYDLLSHRALSYFLDEENDVISPAYKFILNDDRIFSPASEFIKSKFTTQDSASLYFNALLLFQDILKFHLNDASPAALIDADLQRLNFANEHGVFSNKKRLYENALLSIETSYSNNPLAAQAMFLRAQLYYEEGMRYHPFTNKEQQYEIKRAKELCDLANTRFPGSEGAINCLNLLNQIKMPFLNIETELVNIPGQPFRSLVKYKNINTLYFRLIKTSLEQVKRVIEAGYEDNWKMVTDMKTIKTWDIQLPNLQDYQQHSTEIKTEGLSPGVYIILASIDPGFSLSQNIIARQITYVSNISYISNNKEQLYVLNRDNGLPIAKAEVQCWQEIYNYTTRKYEDVKKEKYISDANGFVKLKQPKGSYNNKIQVKYENDELFLDDNIYTYYYNSYNKTTLNRTFLFTDRSIYRPGQILYFKGIVVNTDSTGKKNTIAAGYKTTLTLFDANNQKVSSLFLQTNNYGSYNGNFKLPEGSLNGVFRIVDSVNNSSQYFSVEEYKRPKFFVEIKKPGGTYRVNDSITVKGNAKAFAGNNIDAAVVSYRVVRKIRYPIWWGWGSQGVKIGFPQNQDMEITNGKTTTNTSGEFSFTFYAIPDETIDKKTQPIFYYEVTADITDLNGETRSGNTSVAVGYQMLQLEINAPEKMQGDSIKNIKIKSTNLNDLFEKTRVNVSMYKLITPDRIFRERYWETPDQFIMSKEEYYAAFPHDAYSNEADVSQWPLGNKVFDKTDSTQENGEWPFIKGQLKTGWYKIIANTKDKYGEEVKAEKYILITDGSGFISENSMPVNVESNNTASEPGEKIGYSINTGFDKIWLIHSLNKSSQSDLNTYHTITTSSPFRNELIVTENDRGGMNMSYAFVKNNRIYAGSQYFSIPWSNKDLAIQYETFRDKLLPGSEEKWKIKISGNKKEKVAAETLVSMYDASLDQFRPHDWISLKSLWPIFTENINWTRHGFASVNSSAYSKLNYAGVEQKIRSYDELVHNGWNEGYYRIYERDMAGGKVLSVAAPAMPDGALQEVTVTKNASSKMGNLKSQTDTARLDMVTSRSQPKPEENNNIQVRKNFNETAFFFPSLLTDPEGNIEFSFTIPEALTKWKLLTLAHTTDLASGYTEQSVITQKPLMVQPNPPRFLREGDQIEFSTKIVNLNNKEVSGTAQLQLFDAVTNKPVDGWFKNVLPSQYFTIASGQSFSIKFPIGIPVNFNSALTWRIKAISKNNDFSDGEEAALPVLSNRMLVTESLPLNLRNESTKKFNFDKLIKSESSASLTNHAITVEYASNPAWYAVQALPFLIEYPYECAEQTFNRYYANILASHIANSTPRIRSIFEKWKTADTAALLSNFQKNEELKAVLLQETPWVLDSQNEHDQKKSIALLFDMVRMSKEKNAAFNKLKEIQSSNGGFTWFKGGPDDRYITQYIITGIGHLRKLKSLSNDDYDQLKAIVDKAIPYLDARIRDDYNRLLKYKANLKNNNLSHTAIQYLYMRSFFTEYKLNDNTKTAYDYYYGQCQKYWLSQAKYMQGMISLLLNRSGDNKTSIAIIKSLKENAIYKEEMGMYWKDIAGGGYYWYQLPIESHAMMIEAFTEIDKNEQTVDDLKTWLIKQKQTQNWRTTKATAEACYALLLNGSNWLSEQKEVIINLGNTTTIKSTDDETEAGTGYFKKTIVAEKIKPEMGNISVEIRPVANSTISKSPSWGAIYWQYFEELDKIAIGTETALKLVKKLFIERNSDKGPVLTPLNDGDELHIGDKVKVRIELKVDRDMEYIHMKDMRAACMEPTNVISQYKWQGGLGYYETTKDASTNFFFNWLSRGTYIFEYPMFVTHSGNFSNGITTIQCMYAPEFTSHSDGIRVTVAEK